MNFFVASLPPNAPNMTDRLRHLESTILIQSPKNNYYDDNNNNNNK